MKFKNTGINHKLIFLGVFLILFILNILYILIQEEFIPGYGGEFGNIARSIAAGRGFSNPFGMITGHSSWVPPLLPYLIAFFFVLFGDTLMAFLFLSVIKMLSFALSFLMIVKSLKVSGIKVYPVWLFILFIFYFFMFPNSNFLHIEDLWLNVFIISLFIYAISYYTYDKSTKYFVYLVFISFISTWINPSISMAIMVALLFVFFRLHYTDYLSEAHTDIKKHPFFGFVRSKHILDFIKRYIVCFVFFILSLSVWGYRNYLVFNRFIPVKSNLWFEFYLSNIIDKDGVLSYSTSPKAHPSLGVNVGSVMEMGEAEWLKTFEDTGREFIKNNPKLVLWKVKNRLINATVYSETIKDTEIIRNHDLFSENDLKELFNNKLIFDDIWICLDLDEKEFKSAIKDLDLNNKIFIYDEWKAAKEEIIKRSRTLPYVLKSIFLSPLPLLCIIILLFVRKIRKLYLFQASSIVYILYLIPFILVSHFTRYQKSLFFIQILMIYVTSVLLYELIFHKLTKARTNQV